MLFCIQSQRKDGQSRSSCTCTHFLSYDTHGNTSSLHTVKHDLKQTAGGGMAMGGGGGGAGEGGRGVCCLAFNAHRTRKILNHKSSYHKQ